jgi:rod shape-determining protein MreC
LKIILNKWLVFVCLIVILSIIGVAFTASQNTNNVLVRTVRYVYMPVQSGIDAVRNNWLNIYDFFGNKKLLNQRIAEMEKELDQVKMANNSLNEYRHEAQRLQTLLDFKDSNIDVYDLVAARVIARSPNNWTNSLTISKGSQDGIAENMTVITPDGLVGRVNAVFSQSAEISLITDNEVAVGAIFAENRDTTGIVEGTGQDNGLRMVNIPYYAKINENETVLTSGLSSIYPKGIVIGTIRSVETENKGLLLNTVVIPAVDFNHLEEVLVIINYHPPDGS